MLKHGVYHTGECTPNEHGTPNEQNNVWAEKRLIKRRTKKLVWNLIKGPKCYQNKVKRLG